MFCKKCGKIITEDSTYCRFCGALQDPIDITPTKNTVSSAENNIKHTTSQSEKMIKTNNAVPVKKSIGLRIFVIVSILLAVIICLIVGLLALKNYLDKKEEDKQNAYSLDVSSSDYTFSYDIVNNENVTTTIVPKYDFISFSVKIIYYGDGGLTDYYSSTVIIGVISAGKEKQHTESLAIIEEQLTGDFSYVRVTTISGKKQYKNKTTSQEPVYNTECDFSFIYSSGSHEPLTITIKNNTDKYITELREFRVKINFEKSYYTKFYKPRLIFPSPLAPNEEITIKKITGNFHSYGAVERSEPYYSTSYEEQTYQVIYSSTLT